MKQNMSRQKITAKGLDCQIRFFDRINLRVRLQAYLAGKIRPTESNCISN